jgi:hypothetical protein
VILRLSRLGLVAAALLTVSVFTAAPATADPPPVLFVCTGTSHQSYTPGLTLTAQTTTITGHDEFPCVDAPVTEGTQDFSAVVTAGCLPT